jgi:hypothetical protein
MKSRKNIQEHTRDSNEPHVGPRFDSRTNPGGLLDVRILFVGDADRGERLKRIARVSGADLRSAEKPNDALGLYLWHMPDVVILQEGSCRELFREVYSHLRSVGARPTIVLREQPVGDLSVKSTDHVVKLPPACTSDDCVLQIAEELVYSVPSLFKVQQSRGSTHSGSEHYPS